MGRLTLPPPSTYLNPQILLKQVRELGRSALFTPATAIDLLSFLPGLVEGAAMLIAVALPEAATEAGLCCSGLGSLGLDLRWLRILRALRMLRLLLLRCDESVDRAGD